MKISISNDIEVIESGDLPMSKPKPTRRVRTATNDEAEWKKRERYAHPIPLSNHAKTLLTVCPSFVGGVDGQAVQKKIYRGYHVIVWNAFAHIVIDLKLPIHDTALIKWLTVSVTNLGSRTGDKLAANYYRNAVKAAATVPAGNKILNEFYSHIERNTKLDLKQYGVMG